MTRIATLLFTATAAASCVAARTPPAPPAQVVVGFYDEMRIRTANVYGNVEVRARSYGPGFCTTHVTANDRTVSIAAPPAIYSPWVPVHSHSAALGITLSKRDQCDTGTELQLRYWK